MAAATQPVNSDFSEGVNWLSLVRDQGYRLFAAGNGRAVIVERLPALPGHEKQPDPRPSAWSFDSHYGLGADSVKLFKRFVLLTEVSRVSQSRSRRSSPWNAVRSIQPLANMESFVAREAGKLLFFLVRSARATGSCAPGGPARSDSTAVHIGKSLGLSDGDLDALRVAGLVRQSDEEDVSAIDLGEGKEPGRCNFAGCGSGTDATLDGQSYCKDHFILSCYERLDSCAEQLRQRPVSPQVSDRLRNILTSCIDQSAALTRAPFSQDSLERARLLDIRYTASELRRRLRRSPRVAVSRPVRLLCETPGRPWQEQSHTFGISRFGAAVECKNLVKPEDWLLVERLDTGSRAHARMAWRAPAKSGAFSVGLEILDADNFWGLTWPDPGATR